MRWPWQRKPSTGRHAAVPRQATWAAPALPPQPAPDLSAPAAPLGAVAADTSPAVQLGFSDGSHVDLPASDPSAVALRALADVIVHRMPQ